MYWYCGKLQMCPLLAVIKACEQIGIISNSVGTKDNSQFTVDGDKLYLTYDKHNNPQG